MVKKRKSIFDIILDIIIILLAILIVYWGLQLLFGGSPELNEFNFALIAVISGFLIKLYRESGEIKIGLKYSFNNIKRDITSIKADMALIKKRLKIK